MDRGHYNCRDYYITPHFAAATISSVIEVSSDEPKPVKQDRPIQPTLFARHESFDELEQRSRSPASQQPKFPFLRLPLELRQQIYNYLLPRTISKEKDVSDVSNRQLDSARFSPGPTSNKNCTPRNATKSNVNAVNIIASHIIWQRGNVKLLSVNRQIHDECADILYGGRNTFLLTVTYAGIIFRYSWLLPSGLSPTKRYPFLELMPQRYLARLSRVVVCVEHVDAYTAMIKFNVGAHGLVHGLRGQVQKLVDGLLSPPSLPPSTVSTGSISSSAEDGDDAARASAPPPSRIPLAKLHLRISTANSIVDELKRNRARNSGCGTDSSEIAVQGLAEMLAPFERLWGVRDVAVTGAVTDGLARRLEGTLMADRASDNPEADGANEGCKKSPVTARSDLSYRGIEGDVLRLFAYMNDLT
jgi:hypothetical protein